MPRAIHVFRSPDRFVAGTVGQPGDRTFYLQAVHDTRVISVVLEKQQVAVLAERIDALLVEVNRRFGTPIPPEPDAVADLEPLITPIEAEFRVGTMGWAGTPTRTRWWWSCSPSATPNSTPRWCSTTPRRAPTRSGCFDPESARQFASRSNRVIAAGRPPCPLCDEPLDADGHICARTNGYRRGSWAGDDPVG